MNVPHEQTTDCVEEKNNKINEVVEDVTIHEDMPHLLMEEITPTDIMGLK